MKCLLICLAAGATLVAATPASAQVWFEGGPVRVRVGPPPPPWVRHRYIPDYAYEIPANAVSFASASADLTAHGLSVNGEFATKGGPRRQCFYGSAEGHEQSARREKKNFIPQSACTRSR
jgi:hypothetical protein